MKQPRCRFGHTHWNASLVEQCERETMLALAKERGMDVEWLKIQRPSPPLAIVLEQLKLF